MCLTSIKKGSRSKTLLLDQVKCVFLMEVLEGQRSLMSQRTLQMFDVQCMLVR